MTESTDDSTPEQRKGMRLQRFLAQCGLGSRRECEELISDGRVTVDGEVVSKLGANVRPWEQTVALDGEKLKLEHKKYYVLHKPPGFLCTASDPQGRRTIFDLFPPDGPRLFCVGRLDEGTTGLLIVTNDGNLSQKLAHPRYRIHRLYKAQIAGHPEREVFDQLKQGLFFTEGKFKVHDIRPVKKQGRSTWVEITMTEGQNREIRRLLARTGHKVMKLQRIGFGPVRLGRLGMGEYRELRRDELGRLFEIIERNKKDIPDRESKPSSSGGKRKSASGKRQSGGQGGSPPKRKSSARKKSPPRRGRGR